MNDFLVTRLWLAAVASTTQRAVLGTLAWHADASGSVTLTMGSLARGAGVSLRSVHNQLDGLAGDSWVTITRERSAGGRRNGASTYQLVGLLDPREQEGQGANLAVSQLQPEMLVGRAAGLCFDPERLGPAWAWRVAGCTAAQRVVLGSMALLADQRGVCLAPRSTIAERSLLSLRSAHRVLGELEAKGWVGREPRRRGQRAAEARLSLTRTFLATAKPTRLPAVHGIEPARGEKPELKIVQDGDDLRRHLGAALVSDWVGPDADALANLVADWARHRTRLLVSRRIAMASDEAIADIITLAWLVMRECAEDILKARNPWGLLATIVSRRAAIHDEVTRGIVDRGEAGKLQGFTTVDDATRLDAHTPAVDQQLRGTALGIDDLADAPVMDALVAYLAGLGVDPGLSWPVLCRCVEISLSVQNSRRHTIARKDYMLAALGLTPAQASAWMNLITGTRRLGKEASALANASRLAEAIPQAWVNAITAA